MVALSSGQAILFGIQAGVRLFGAARQAYIEHTRARKLTLPLPGAPSQATHAKARTYFRGDGAPRLARDSHLKMLHAKAEAGLADFKREFPEEAAEYLQLYKLGKADDSGKDQLGNRPFRTRDAAALLAISQWKEGGQPHPSALKRIAGTLVEIGIDYYATGPGKLSGDTPERKILLDLVGALDDHSFVDQAMEGVVEKLFVAGLESVAENPVLLDEDPRAQVFVAAVARGIAGDINERLHNLPESSRYLRGKDLGAFGGLVLKSVLRHSGKVILSNPATFLGARSDGESALASSVGAILLDALVPENGDMSLSRLFSSETLDSLVKSVLGVVAEHPELLKIQGKHKAPLESILSGVAAGLANSTEKIGPDLLPELARLVLEKSAGHLDQLWDADSPGEHLLLTASKSLLETLALHEPGEGHWKPRFGKDRMLSVAQSVLDEVVQNPQLVTYQRGDKPALEAAVKVALAELGRVPLKDLSQEHGAGVLRAAVQAAANRFEFFKFHPEFPAPETKRILGHVLAALVSTVFGQHDERRISWQLAKGSAFEGLATISLEKLSESKVDESALNGLREALGEVQDRLEGGGSLSLEHFASALESKIAG